ncbi:MAG: radical SAM family heme chaperone HemW [Alphaproteobacteria bacterium]|nr:radical SAM family heme chaperone HemW [Alphaproteobacteria bacterium]
MNPLSIYIHWPFCAAKCPYCDFNSRPLTSDLDADAWEAAYLRELSFYADHLSGHSVHTIYFGGGTPSLMREKTIAAILNKIAAVWDVQHFCEITLEANPSSSEIGKFSAFKSAGVNRLSLGVQALNDADLRFLGRVHDGDAAREAIEMAKKTFDRFSFDLIYARRGQTPAAWQTELTEALAFGAQHMSLYQLTIEEGTVFHKRARQERFTASDDDAAAMFELTQDLMAQAGVPAYEISNHAAPGQESRHNLTYWNYGEYIGIGPGAHGRFVQEKVRYAAHNLRQPAAWLQQVMEKGHGLVEREALDVGTAQREALMMGLRLTAGIDLSAWFLKFGQPLSDNLSQERVACLQAQGLLSKSETHLAATAAGRQRLNAVLDYLLNDGT